MKMNILLISIGVLLVAIGLYRIVHESSSFNEEVYHKPGQDADKCNKDKSLVLTNTVDDTPERQILSDAVEITQSDEELANSTVSAYNSDKRNLKQDAKSKGNDFENFVANFFTDRSLYTILEWNQGQTSSEGVYAKADENPDFKIEHKLSDDFKITYWLECKYRTSFNSGAVIIKNYQLDRYRKIQKDSHRKILIAIGIGGTPSSPHSFYLIPLDSIKEEKISFDDLKQYYLSSPKDRYDSWVTSYFRNKVFKKSKTK